VFAEAGIKFERHLAHFRRGTDDVTWLSFVGEKGWIVITKDKSQRFNPLERAELQKHRIKQFAFQSGNLSATEMAELLKANLRRIFNLIKKHPAPFVASLTKSGVNPRTVFSN
jgi:PIN like domain